MSAYIDLVGRTYGRWTVLRVVEASARNRRWWCRCSCGAEVAVQATNLCSGKSRSCGCLRNEAARQRRTRHGQSGTAEYEIWLQLRQRCRNPRHRQWRDYGGRGITVCDRWDSFENFIVDMGLRPSPELTVERVDNNAGYSKANCIWAPMLTQSRNTRQNRMLTLQGETKCISAWAEHFGVSAKAALQRINKLGWDPAVAVTTPVKSR